MRGGDDAAGLEVWFRPFTNGLTQDAWLDLLVDCAERLRQRGRHAVAACRARFGGRVSYASLPLEGVDWSVFDIIATDAVYRTAPMAARFRDHIRAFVAQGRALGKPVAATEFWCGCRRGAATWPTPATRSSSGARMAAPPGRSGRRDPRDPRYPEMPCSRRPASTPWPPCTQR